MTAPEVTSRSATGEGLLRKLNTERGPQPYGTSLEHLLAHLERIDLLIQVQVARARALHATDEQFQGLYIPEEEVDALLARPAGLPHWAMEDDVFGGEVKRALGAMAAEISSREAESEGRGVELRLVELARLFGLTPSDVDVLLICLAPELDLRYERLYGYLHDDVTKKRPSVDLVLNLLCPSFEDKVAARERFASGAPLLRHDLLVLFDDPSHQNPPLIGKYLKVDDHIAAYLLGSDEIDPRLEPYCRRVDPSVGFEDLSLASEMKQQIRSLVRSRADPHERFVFYFQGPYGVGKRSTAEALCRELGIGLLVVDGKGLLTAEGLSFGTATRLALREARLREAALYWEEFDGLLAEDREAHRKVMLAELEAAPGLIFLAGEEAWEPADALYDTPFFRIELPRPSHQQRVQLWRMALDGNHPGVSGLDLEAVAGKFRLTGGQIRDAAATARNLARLRDPENAHIAEDDLHAACRLQSNRRLGELARQITPRYTRADIVLPDDRMEQLREICNHVKYRSVVYEEWGFGRKLSLGKGLNVLFAGPSGTGKTMAAEVVANELGLDLYKIDLSGVVSKYIGETEKNLARIFAEAEASNAILFFDEADALFGKRSEVRDAHDRYANIEVGYLLQKMEEYEGIVILATNFRRNMDDAFVRRMHFAVEFPLPAATDRRRIWEAIWPQETPRAETLDLELLARRLEITGGNIKNIAVSATFLAAEDGGIVDQAHVKRATQREYQKMGKVVVGGEFGDYSGLVKR